MQKRPSYSTHWFDRRNCAPNSTGIVTSEDGKFGLGALLIIECSTTGRFLMARKANRPGYEMNHRLTFPGGMIRSDTAVGSMNDWIETSLNQRVMTEVGINCDDLEIYPLDQYPPVVATYNVQGRRVTTAIMAFHAVVRVEIQADEPRDDSTYDPRWRELSSIWPETSDANGVSLIPLVWDRLALVEASRAKALLSNACSTAIEDAREAQLPAPLIPWS